MQTLDQEVNAQMAELRKWNTRFLLLAKHISAWSKDPSTKCGAVISDENRRIVSMGYNGFPMGVLDSPARLDNRETKYKLVVHAERNALLFAKRDLSGCILYTWPILTCSQCAAMVIQSGIELVVCPVMDPSTPLHKRWEEDFFLAQDMYAESC